MRTRSLAVLLPLVLLLPLSVVAQAAEPAVAAEPVPVASYDFEDATTQGWFGRGDAVLDATTAPGHSGVHSLRTSGRTAGWQGPSVELVGALRTGGTYAVSVFVRLAASQAPATVQLTVQRTPTGGATTYDFVTNGVVTDAAWVELRGSYLVPSDSSQLQLYVESSDPTASYDIDDVTIVETTPPPTGPPDQAGLSSTFEDGTAQSWASRSGPAEVAVSDVQAHSGRYSLLTTGRTQSWMGPVRSLLGKLGKGSTYTLSAWVRLAAGEAPSSLKMSMERRSGGTPSYDRVTGDTDVTADGWVELRGQYTLAYDVDYLAAYVESTTGTASFHLDDFTLTYLPPLPIQTDIPSVKDVVGADFAIGAAIGRPQTVGAHADLLLKHFNSVTPGNALKWDATEPVEGQFHFEESDAEVAFAVDHHLAVRGHTLVWHSQVPAWVFQDAAGNPMTPTPENKALLLRREEAHIRALVGRYAGKIGTWDVVNEVVDEYSSDGMRHSPWYTIAGLDFIRTAFRVAHEVDPAAKLVLNEYNTDLPAKQKVLLDLLRRLRAEGVPIDGIGHQFHIDIEKPSGSRIEQTIAAFAALGLDNQVTELDISVYPNFVDRYESVPADVLATQGYRYAEVFAALRRQAAHISSVTTWGLADDGTWLSVFPITRLNPPLLFDDRLQAKPAYWGVVDPSRLPPLRPVLTVPSGTPKIDGNDEVEWAQLPRTEVIAAHGLSARFGLRWSPGRVALLIDVNDTTATGGDAVDLTIGGTHVRLGGTAHPPPGAVAAVRHSSKGYRIEASIPVLAASAGARLPIDLAVTDARKGGETVSWHGTLSLTAAVRRIDVGHGTPVIDGATDPVWDRVTPTDTPVAITGGAGAATATVRLLWDSQRLYVLATVTDPTLDESSPNPWEQDSVEVFVDPDNAKSSGYADDDGQYRVSFSDRQSLGGNFNAYAIAGNLTSATRLIPGGYVVEAAIDLPAAHPAPGTLLGFDLQVNDATGGARTGTRGWADPTGLSYVNTSRWGVIRLVSGLVAS